LCMFWALARAGLVLELPKSLAVTRIFFFMVYDGNYFNCSTLVTITFYIVKSFLSSQQIY
jgi:hypothetical protein